MPALFEPEAIESECMWLNALAEDTDLVVQRPVSSPEGGYVLSLLLAESAERLPCTMLTWVDGEVLTERRTAEMATRLGELIATLQNHGRPGSHPPDSRDRHMITIGRANSLDRIDGLVKDGIAQSDHHALLVRAFELIDEELGSSEATGLIHADLHQENYVVLDGDLRPIDFGLCGFGPWLKDVAEAIGYLSPDRRHDLVEAYARSRPFPTDGVRRVEGHLLTALIEVWGYHAPDPTERENLSRAIPAYQPNVQRY